MTRIIAGSRKGHRLRTPAHSATRPTTDRVREASFSLIAAWAGTAGDAADEMLAGFSFLDLFAGSGVALEAASRGAAPVLAVESDQATARIARGNAKETGLAVTVLAATVEQTLAGEPAAPFDVVWADPPYAVPAERLGPVLAAAIDRWLAADGLLVLERSSRDPAPEWPPVVTDSWQRRYGETTLYFATKGQ